MMLENFSIILIIMSNSNKDDIISSIYYDRSGFGSIATTYKDSRAKDKTITLDDVRDWFKRNVEQKAKPRGYNSFVAPHDAFEFQMDLFFLSDLKNQKFKVAFLFIDTFSKYAVVIPIKSKQPEDVAMGIIEGLNKMGKKPKMVYADMEGSFTSNIIKEYFDKEGIELYLTRGHAPVAERFIRTYKQMLYKRIEHDEKQGKENIQWTDYNFEVLLTYNNKMKHSATNMTPKEARLPKNELTAKLHMTAHAKKTRTYPEIDISDKVKIARKKEVGEKERTSNWSQNKYTIERIEEKLGQKYYYVEGSNRPYLRHELLKV